MPKQTIDNELQQQRQKTYRFLTLNTGNIPTAQYIRFHLHGDERLSPLSFKPCHLHTHLVYCSP